MKTDLMRADISGGDLLSVPSPRPSRFCQTRRGENSRGRVCVPNAATIWMPQFTKPLRGTRSQGSSVQAGLATLATAGLICETRFGVLKMVALQSRHPYGVLRLPASAKRRRSSDTDPLLQVRQQDYRKPRTGEPPKRDQACSLSCPRAQLHLRPRTGPEGTGKAVPQSPEPILSTCDGGKSPMREDGQL